MRMDCKERVFCTHCRTANHDTKACRKYHSNVPSPTNSHSPAGYHPTATPPPLMGATTAIQQTQQTGAANNRPLFQNLFDNNQHRISTTIHTPFNGTSPAPSANMTEALTQIMAKVTQVANNNKKESQQRDDEEHQDLRRHQQSRMHHLAQPSRSNSQVYQYIILRTNLPEHAALNVTYTFRTFSTRQ